MKKILIAILFVFFVVGVVSAADLVADKPSFIPTVCEVEINGGTPQTANCTVSGDNIIFLDVSGLAPGQYTFRGRWKNDSWPEFSAWSDPYVATKPEKPGNVRVE
jgi:hypothetical protein